MLLSQSCPIYYKLLILNQAGLSIIWTVCYGGSSNQIYFNSCAKVGGLDDLL